MATGTELPPLARRTNGLAPRGARTRAARPRHRRRRLRRLCPRARLLDRGHHVRLLDRLYWGLGPINDVLDQVDLLHADIREVQPQWFEGIDGVIHLAGLSNDPTANFDPEANWQMNARATESWAPLPARPASVASSLDRVARSTMACPTAPFTMKMLRSPRAPTRDLNDTANRRSSIGGRRLLPCNPSPGNGVRIELTDALRPCGKHVR